MQLGCLQFVDPSSLSSPDEASLSDLKRPPSDDDSDMDDMDDNLDQPTARAEVDHPAEGKDARKQFKESQHLEAGAWRPR